MVLLVEPLHGVTFACAQLASVQYCAQIAPPGLETSTQGLKDAVRSAGGIVGVFLAGIVTDTFGSTVVYRGAAGVVGLALVCYACFHRRRLCLPASAAAGAGAHRGPRAAGERKPRSQAPPGPALTSRQVLGELAEVSPAGAAPI